MDASFTAEEQLRRGIELLDQGALAAACECFRAAHSLDPAHPRYRSYHGLGLALGERRFSPALELCRAAAKEEFFNPEQYLNLARIHLAFGFKAEGIRYLRRGLMIDPQHAAIRAELARLGVRSSPVLRFLPRRHLLNRYLGRLRQRFGRGARSPEGAGAPQLTPGA